MIANKKKKTFIQFNFDKCLTNRLSNIEKQINKIDLIIHISAI